MKQHGRAGQHPEQRERAHAHAPAEQLVDPCDQPGGAPRGADRARAHPSASRVRLLKTSTVGASSLCQDVTLASR
jgi:hypothetical protein